MARIDNLLGARLKALGKKPADSAQRPAKQKWSQKVSEATALAFADELRQRGLKGAMPDAGKGAERRMAGGIGAKQVDVSWATDASGLVAAISVKTINFPDGKTKNFQKNLTNRRGDMLFESVTLHRRFPFAVLSGFLMLDKRAAADNTAKRRSTFINAHSRLRLFTGRQDPAGREEQYEKLYIMLTDINPTKPSWKLYSVGEPTKQVKLDDAFTDLIELVGTRNPDFYEAINGELKRAA